MAEKPLEFTSPIVCESAQPGEAAVLTDLCMRSKAHWGYDDLFMHRSREALTITQEDIAAGWVIVARHKDKLCGVAELSPIADPASAAFTKAELTRVELDKLFVDPNFMGQGVGRQLMKAAKALAREHGFTAMEILSDPNAVSFYERMGARFIEDAPSDTIPGRTLPLYELSL